MKDGAVQISGGKEEYSRTGSSKCEGPKVGVRCAWLASETTSGSLWLGVPE